MGYFKEEKEKNKNPLKLNSFKGLNGERAGIRTLGPLIKSQMLYQLSYTLIICKTDRLNYA